jgi:hypothetical protein
MDGVTDDYAALQAVVSLAGPDAVIYFPPSANSLLVSSYIGIPSNQTWWAHPGSVTMAPTAGNVSAALLWATSNTTNVRIEGLTFDGGGQDFASNNVVSQAYRVSGLILDRVTYQNTRGMAFNGSGNNDLVVRGCTFRNIGNHWKTTGSAADWAQAFSQTSGDGIAWGFRTRIEGCLFTDCGSDNINLGAIQDSQVTDNVFVITGRPWDTVVSAAYTAAIYALYCNGIVVSNNLIIAASGNALDFPAVWNGVISGNTIRNSGQAGIGLFDGGYPGFTNRACRDITITGNIIQNSGQWSGGPFHDGINIGTSSTAIVNIRIANNIISDTQTTKTQQYGVSYTGPAPTGIWVDPSNILTGNATGPRNGLPPTAVTGAKGGNAALTSLLTTLAGFGLITDSTT